MARAIWTGSISFGLLNVPVKLYSAVSSRSISFRELRDGDHSRIRHKRVAEEDGEEVPYEKIVKGYEIAPEQYVILSRDELEDLAPKKTKAIQIEDFVDLDEIDPIYFDRPYYLGPQPGAERAYALLAKAMAEQRKVAIARFVCATRRASRRSAPTGRRADAGDDALRRRGRPAGAARRAARRGRGRRAEQEGGRDGEGADRLPRLRLRAVRLQGRVPRRAARPDRAQGRAARISSPSTRRRRSRRRRPT